MTRRTALRPPRLAVVWGSIAAAICLACSPEARSPSFVVVIVDTLRLDRLHFAQPEAATTPNFDRLRAESVWFSRAYANSSWTLPSVASLLLSQRPTEHGVASWGSRLASDQVSLPDVLRASGYRSSMFTANRIIAGERGFVGRFDEGRLIQDAAFTGELHTASAFAGADDVSAAGLAWIAALSEERAAPYLALLHYMDPHAPYPCPNAAPPSCAGDARALNERLLGFDWNFSDAERARVADHYTAGVAKMDAALGRLLDALDAAGVLDEAWVVLLADHGELLGETDLYLHGRSLGEALVRVPLLFRPPGGGPAVTAADPVSLMDVAPTLLALAGRAAPPAFRGHSFAAALDGEPTDSRPLVLELPQVRPVPDTRRQHVFSLIDGDAKFLVAADGSVRRRPLGGGALSLAESVPRDAFLARLSALGIEFDPSAYGDAAQEEPTAEMLDALRRLGYIE